MPTPSGSMNRGVYMSGGMRAMKWFVIEIASRTARTRRLFCLSAPIVQASAASATFSFPLTPPAEPPPSG